MELNLQNKTFGYWKVIEKDSKKSKEKGIGYWFCECTLCGNIYSVRGTVLNKGQTTKCVHCSGKIINEIDKKYNQLKVLQYAGRKNNRAMWKCECECGNHIVVSGTDLRMGNVKSCGRCPNKESNGEKYIRKFLINCGIDFIQEYIFEDFTYENGHHPRFDFYIPSRHYIIEYDGKQHFQYQKGSNWNTEEKLKENIKKDNYKNQYCFKNNIPIIRIPYYEKEITVFDLIPETSRFLIKKE